MKKSILLVTFIFLSFFFSGYAFSSEGCLACHEDPDLLNEEGKSVFVDSEKFLSSLHGELGLECVDCHTDLKGFEDFPHPENLQQISCSECHEEAKKEFQQSIHSKATLELNGSDVFCKDCHGTHYILRKENYKSQIFPLNLPRTCERCHLETVKTERGQEFIKRYEQSIHFKALERSGLVVSSNCSTCHGAHDIRKVHDPASQVSKKNIIKTCGKCHVGIEIDYLEGVHGQDYLKGSMDIPVCTDCHSEHDIVSPQDLGSHVYATKVSAACSKCHDDEALSRQYGFTMSRLKTYTKSFHGTASRFGETRVANCASCHGFHGIRRSSDPKSLIYPDNLPQTCGKCHPGAGKNFAIGKIHVVSERTENKWAYFVKIFYTIIIASFVGIALIFISADFLHRIRNRELK